MSIVVDKIKRDTIEKIEDSSRLFAKIVNLIPLEEMIELRKCRNIPHFRVQLIKTLVNTVPSMLKDKFDDRNKVPCRKK